MKKDLENKLIDMMGESMDIGREAGITDCISMLEDIEENLEGEMLVGLQFAISTLKLYKNLNNK